MSELESLFSPKSVAIIGVSTTPGKNGYEYTRAFLDEGYEGKFFLVNPKGGKLDGYPIFKSLEEINEPIDVALILVSRENAKNVVIDCANHGVKFGILFTSGFGETDDKNGLTLQHEIVNIARDKGMRIVGPNCQGIFSSPSKLNLAYERRVPGGKIGMISQSGNMLTNVAHDAATYLETGFSRMVSLGNQADIAIYEYLAYLRDDSETSVIIMYLEGILPGMGSKFIEVAKQTTRIKPIVVIKGGWSEAGQRAASSHTGSLAGNHTIYSSAFKQAGIIEVDNYDEFLPVAQALLNCPTFNGDQIAVIGSSGGHMTLSTDQVARNGFNVPVFSPQAIDKLPETLPYYCTKSNPVEMAGSYLNDLRYWSQIAEVALDEQNIGGAIIYGRFGLNSEQNTLL